MNYFAHGRLFTDDPYFLAGTAVPDWLNVVARRVKVRSKHARPFVDDPDLRVAALARGIEQHHADDRWFHETRAFAELSWHFTARIRDGLPADDGLRPSFLGHILVEILLDACLIDQAPAQLDAYYRALAAVDGRWLEAAVGQMATGHPESLGDFIPLFIRERFLWDYLDDGKLCYRLNQVMRRVGLAALPDTFRSLLADMRQMVQRSQHDLLSAG
ncbi:MAG: hypothetical protein B7Z73_01355 [Planctomycetia bacterium 21-64-5]|nr:MAG: hypothetical protein B7Z73_01355 [Planctomycetia bacterium 21-64-5]HQU42947.1 hypothetical protein [Pirellulales bacterium]